MKFLWTEFYEAIADSLLRFRSDRSKLVAAVRQSVVNAGLSPYNDKTVDGSSVPLEDICPFTTIGTFNRRLTDSNRRKVAESLAKFLDVSAPVPQSFEGIPILDPLRSWFFYYKKDRYPNDIDHLWNVFEKAISLTNSNDESASERFQKAYDEAMKVQGTGWTLTFGLYWIRPWNFCPLDSNSRQYLKNELKLDAAQGICQRWRGEGNDSRCSGKEYVDIINELSEYFEEDKNYPVRSFPELSLKAFEGPRRTDDPMENEVNCSYTIDNIVEDGCFIERQRLQTMLDRIEEKRNLILQGPPGTGKTWLAKRLAYALVGKRPSENVKAFQFHPNLSYEDFVQGWRPGSDGKLELIKGDFLQIADKARVNKSEKYVAVIEEINRGNPAQIFGELLTLLEADKRTREEALELSYSRAGESVYLPENLYVIGTMNVADRSLALVDLALRRRFTFFDLQPAFNDLWEQWANKWITTEKEIIDRIKSRLIELNKEISKAPGLGKSYCVGHSFVTPAKTIDNPKRWFRQIVETEIGPMLDELWFDDESRSREAKEKLLEGF